MFHQLPQCLCIHLQRLTWSSEGTPIKRQEHVQFTEYLSMDRYKHSASPSSLQQTNSTAQSVHPQSSGEWTKRLSFTLSLQMNWTAN